MGLSLAVGAGVWRLGLLPRARWARQPAPATLARARELVALAGALGAAAGMAAAAWALVAQMAALGDADAGTSMLGALVWHTRWGQLWAAQLAPLAVATGAGWAARANEARRRAAPPAAVLPNDRPGRGWWLVAAAAAAGATALEGVMGHAGADPAAPFASLVLGASHVLAAATWLGTLAILVLVWRRAGGKEPAAFAAPQLAAFAPVALAAALVTALAGVGNAWLRLAGAVTPTNAPPGVAPSVVARLAALAATPYGRLLVAKLVVVLVVAAAGAVNARRSAAHRTATRAASTASELNLPTIDRGARIELAAALAVVVLSAVLAVSSPPGAE